MSLPIVKFPTYTTEINGTKIKFRNFNIEEHKALLTAIELGDAQSILDTMMDIVDSCTFKKMDINNVSQGMLEYLFLQIYIKSSKNKVDGNFTCNHNVTREIENVTIVTDEKGNDIEEKHIEFQDTVCGSQFKIVIPIEKAELKSENGGYVDSKTLNLYDTVEINVKYPPAIEKINIEKESLEKVNLILEDDTLNDYEKRKKSKEIQIEIDTKLVYLFIDNIKDLSEDKVFTKDDKVFSYEKFKDWFNQLPSDIVEQLNEFVNNEPVLSLDYEVKCPDCGGITPLKFRSLDSFFV